MKDRPKIVALTFKEGFSGINKPLFENLKQRWEVEIIDAEYVPSSVKLIKMIKTFSFNKLRWGNRYHQELAKYTIKPKTFLQRTNQCKKKVKNLKGKVALLYQGSALFSASDEKIPVPYVIYIDFTSKLAEELYPEWVPFRSDSEKENWYELENALYNKVDLILVFNEIVRQSLMNHYGIGSDKIRVIGSGVNLDDLSDFDKVYEPILLFVCRDFKRHGGEIVLKSFKLVQKKIKDLKLFIVGVDFKSGDDNIITTGNLNRQRLDSLYRRASGLVMPAKVGGLQTVLEAMARKCCCFVSEGNPHLADLIKDLETGIVSPFGDEVELAERVIDVLENEAVLKKIGEKGYLQVKENYTWAKVVEKMENEFLNILKIVE
jgi:glycosyltransferase involved in cell wall biosynthesis